MNSVFYCMINKWQWCLWALRTANKNQSKWTFINIEVLNFKDEFAIV